MPARIWRDAPAWPAWQIAAAAGVLATGVVFALDAGGSRPALLIGTLQLLAAAAVVAGVRWLRPSLPLPWWLVAAGLVANGVRRIVLAAPAFAAIAEVEPLARALHPASLALYVAAAATVVVARAHGRPTEQLLSAAVLVLAAALMAGEALRLLVASPVGLPAVALPPMALVMIGAVLVAVTVHLWRAGRHLNMVVVLLVGAATTRLVRDLVGVAGVADAGVLASAATALSPLSFGLVAAALLHPRSPQLVEPVECFEPPSNARQTAAFGGALFVLPLLWVSLGLREPDDQWWVWLMGLGMVALTSLVLARLVGLVGSLNAAAALREAEAHRDVATGLPNSRALLADLARRIGQRDVGGPPALMVVGLRGVGEAESVHGLEVSAELLRALADRLASAVPADATVAVLSGQDLAVVVDPRPQSQLEALGWRLHELSTSPVTARGVSLTCGASVGVAVHEEGEGPEGLLRRADLASRWAERPESNRVECYELPMASRVAHEVSLRARVREAIRHEQLELWCQPQLELATGRLTGVECLARWHDPWHGRVPPDVFVPAAREIGMAAELDGQMVRAAMRQAKSWRAAGLLVPRVAVNVEPTTLADPTFVDTVASVLQQAALPPWTLEIELTESVTAHDHVEAGDVLWQLRALGVRLAVDDFGTGYSSLANLHHLPMDAIKLDRELVGLLTDEPVLVTTTIALADWLGLELIAEGVETRRQLAQLEHLGCRMAQGFLLAEPMPAAQLLPWSQQRPPWASQRGDDTVELPVLTSE